MQVLVVLVNDMKLWLRWSLARPNHQKCLSNLKYYHFTNNSSRQSAGLLQLASANGVSDLQYLSGGHESTQQLLIPTEGDNYLDPYNFCGE